MAAEGRESYWNSTLAYFSEPKKQDFTRYFQSLDTNSCELIIIDRPGAHIFAQHAILCSDHVSAHIFGRRFCIAIDHGRSPTGKSAKILFMANCGMRVAVEIGVSCDHVSRFYRYLWHAPVTMFGSEYMYKGTAAPLVRCALAKGCGGVG